MGIKFNRRNKPKAIVDMIPMIDIVFQLVIFFMVATTFKTITGMELELPKANHLSSVSITPLKIYILNEKDILVGDKKTTISEFQKVIKNEVVKDFSMKKSVILYGNKNMEYQLLIEVMDILRIEGYESIDLAIKKKL